MVGRVEILSTQTSTRVVSLKIHEVKEGLQEGTFLGLQVSRDTVELVVLKRSGTRPLSHSKTLGVTPFRRFSREFLIIKSFTLGCWEVGVPRVIFTSKTLDKVLMV